MDWLARGTSLNIAVIGAGGGIGQAFVGALSAMEHRVTGLGRSRPAAWTDADWHDLDVEDEASIALAAQAIEGELDLVVVAVGVLSDGEGLRPEKSWRQLDGDAAAKVFAINALGPALCAKHFLPKLARERKAVFAALSARVGSISDNRLGGWHSYRASKAALNMFIKNFAIELKINRRYAVCIGLHPGTVDTGLSKPFQAGVPQAQLFEPEDAVSRLLAVIDSATPKMSGRVFDYASREVPA